jgi:hypothetical protein
MDNQRTFSALCREVHDNWEWLQAADLHSEQWLSERVLRLYAHVGPHVHLQDTVPANKRYEWTPLLQHRASRAGWLYLPAGGETRPHDHHNSIAVSLVVNGKPTLSQCDILTGHEKSHSYSRSLTEPRILELDAGQLSFAFPEKFNIHGFTSPDSPALLFNVIFSRNKESRSCFSWSGERVAHSHRRDTTRTAWLRSAVMVSCLASGPAFGDCYSIFLDENGRFQISRETIHELIRCAESGNTLSQFRLAGFYNCGILVERSPGQAFHWYLEAAKNGHPDAQYQVGMMLIEGRGVTDNSYEGLDWLFKSAKNGHAQAKETFEYIMRSPEILDC